MNLLKQINRIERIDQLIRMKATGTPKELAKRLSISRSTLYNILDFIKNQGVQIRYCPEKQSFYYVQDVHFYFGFSFDKVQLRGIVGGEQKIFLNFFYQSRFIGLS